MASVLEGNASQIWGIAEKLGVFEGMEEELTRELVRFGYGLEEEAGGEEDRRLGGGDGNENEGVGWVEHGAC